MSFSITPQNFANARACEYMNNSKTHVIMNAKTKTCQPGPCAGAWCRPTRSLPTSFPYSAILPTANFWIIATMNFDTDMRANFDICDLPDKKGNRGKTEALLVLNDVPL